MNRAIFLFLLASIIHVACKVSYIPINFEQGSQEAIDNEKIIAYLKANKIKNATHTESGIYYLIETNGTGESPSRNAQLTAHYRGTLLDGTQFDSSYNRGTPLQFRLDQVIKGWGESISLLKKEGKGKFFIPSGLAYGSSASRSKY